MALQAQPLLESGLYSKNIILTCSISWISIKKSKILDKTDLIVQIHVYVASIQERPLFKKYFLILILRPLFKSGFWSKVAMNDAGTVSANDWTSLKLDFFLFSLFLVQNKPWIGNPWFLSHFKLAFLCVLTISQNGTSSSLKNSRFSQFKKKRTSF